MSEAKDPESVFVVLWPDGKPLLCETSDPTEDIAMREKRGCELGMAIQPLHVTRYNRDDPELQAHLLKGAELLRASKIALVHSVNAYLQFVDEQLDDWLAADEKLRGAG